MKIYEIIAELDKSRRGFLKKLGKGALGVAGAAAMSAIPFSKAQASNDDKIKKFAMLAEKFVNVFAEKSMKIARVTTRGESISLSDSLDGAPKGNGMVSFKITGVSRYKGFENKPVDGFISVLLKDYLVTNIKFSGTPYPDINITPKAGSMIQIYFSNHLR